jgi:hypothetical protein
LRRFILFLFTSGFIFTGILGPVFAIIGVDFCVNGRWSTIPKISRAKYTSIFFVCVVFFIETAIQLLSVPENADQKIHVSDQQITFIALVFLCFSCLAAFGIIHSIRRMYSTKEAIPEARSKLRFISDALVVCLCVTGLAFYLQEKDATDRVTNLTRNYGRHIGSWSGCVPSNTAIYLTPPSMMSRLCPSQMPEVR